MFKKNKTNSDNELLNQFNEFLEFKKNKKTTESTLSIEDKINLVAKKNKMLQEENIKLKNEFLTKVSTLETTDTEQNVNELLDSILKGDK